MKEKSSEEMMQEKSGTIPVGFSILNGKIGYDDEPFSVMLSGSKLYFSFEKGKRRVSLNLDSAIYGAYELSRE